MLKNLISTLSFLSQFRRIFWTNPIREFIYISIQSICALQLHTHLQIALLHLVKKIAYIFPFSILLIFLSTESTFIKVSLQVISPTIQLIILFLSIIKSSFYVRLVITKLFPTVLFPEYHHFFFFFFFFTACCTGLPFTI